MLNGDDFHEIPMKFPKPDFHDQIPWKFHQPGTGHLRGSLERRIEELGIGKAVTFKDGSWIGRDQWPSPF